MQKRNNKILVVLVDMGGVLLDHELALRKTTEKLGISYKKFKSEINKIYKRCEVDGTTIDSFWRYSLDESGYKNIEVSKFKQTYDKGHKKNKKLLKLLKKLKSNGIKLGMVTNNIKGHIEELDNIFGLVKIFNWIFDSSEMRARKPEREYYEKIWRTIKLSKNKCLFVDDNLGHVQAAAKFGFKTFHFSDFEKSNEDLAKYFKI